MLCSHEIEDSNPVGPTKEQNRTTLSANSPRQTVGGVFAFLRTWSRHSADIPRSQSCVRTLAPEPVFRGISSLLGRFSLNHVTGERPGHMIARSTSVRAVERHMTHYWSPIADVPEQATWLIHADLLQSTRLVGRRSDAHLARRRDYDEALWLLVVGPCVFAVEHTA